MKKVNSKSLLLGVCCCLASAAASADVNCVVSEFQVEAYDHGGAYLHGKLNGVPAEWIIICGVTPSGTASDCSSKATDRRLAIALAAQAMGKNLLAYIRGINSCSQFQPYTVVGGLRTMD